LAAAKQAGNDKFPEAEVKLRQTKLLDSFARLAAARAHKDNKVGSSSHDQACSRGHVAAAQLQ
jgi:hypothetical protein